MSMSTECCEICGNLIDEDEPCTNVEGHDAEHRVTISKADALLRRALELLNDRPNFGLRRDASVTSYKLAAAIDAHFAAQVQA